MDRNTVFKKRHRMNIQQQMGVDRILSRCCAKFMQQITDIRYLRKWQDHQMIPFLAQEESCWDTLEVSNTKHLIQLREKIKWFCHVWKGKFNVSHTNKALVHQSSAFANKINRAAPPTPQGKKKKETKNQRMNLWPPSTRPSDMRNNIFRRAITAYL